MKIDWLFPRQILIATTIIWVLGGYPLISKAENSTIIAVIFGMILSIINVLLGFLAIQYSIGKSTATFFKFVIGGMGLRLLIFAVVLVVMIKIYSIPSLALISSLGIFYMVFLVLEVLYIQKKVEIKQQN
ncbi:MAG: hypothetical protein HY964_03430 [Ignavibacteriales bacterium]|nr:hypothetical protein [Ignavibacteriales bacterium]